MIEKHYKTAEVAELLSVAVDTVLRLAQRGEIRSVRIGHDRRYPESAVREFLERNTEGGRAVVASIESLIAFLRRHAQAKRTEDALYSWQQTADEQERELAVLRGALVQAQKVVDSFDRKPTEGCVRDVGGLAESLRRYRQMRDGSSAASVPRLSQTRSASGR